MKRPASTYMVPCMVCHHVKGLCGVTGKECGVGGGGGGAFTFDEVGVMSLDFRTTRNQGGGGKPQVQRDIEHRR